MGEGGREHGSGGRAPVAGRWQSRRFVLLELSKENVMADVRFGLEAKSPRVGLGGVRMEHGRGRAGSRGSVGGHWCMAERAGWSMGEVGQEGWTGLGGEGGLTGRDGRGGKAGGSEPYVRRTEHGRGRAGGKTGQ